MEISEERFRAIEKRIVSESSPVGIDAKKTHVMILHALEEISARLIRVEERLDAHLR